MYFFNAITTAAPGRNHEATEVVQRYAEVATAAHGIPTSAWVCLTGAPYGTYGLSARIEGTEQLLEAFAKLGANEEWNTLAEQTGSVFVGPAETGYSKVIAATTDDIGRPPLVSVTRAVAAPGHLQQAVVGAVEVLEFVKAATGIDGLLTMSASGPMNQVGWLFGVESGAQGDEAEAKLAENPEWPALMDQIGPHFSDRSGERMLIARL